MRTGRYGSPYRPPYVYVCLSLECLSVVEIWYPQPKLAQNHEVTVHYIAPPRLDLVPLVAICSRNDRLGRFESWSPSNDENAFDEIRECVKRLL